MPRMVNLPTINGARGGTLLSALVRLWVVGGGHCKMNHLPPVVDVTGAQIKVVFFTKKLIFLKQYQELSGFL